MKFLFLFLFIFPLFASQCLALENAKLPGIPKLIEEANQVRWAKSVQHTVLVEASVEEVWNYLSDSEKAKDWSVFFDHIIPLPGISDGQPGSLRRCFKYENETGGRWDEMTIVALPLKKREIVTFNLQGFGYKFLLKNQYIFVRQLYRSIGPNQTLLTFQTMHGPLASLKTKVSFALSKKDVQEIFKKNLVNIKSNIEFHQRIFPWKE